MIAVCITTYNHEPYIAKAIESVIAQQCDEPLRIYIADDASTDNTELVCRSFAAKDKRIVYIRREANLGIVQNTISLYHQVIKDGCGYIAMLDGDDYWTDTHKTQLQLDFLRSHPDCGFVHTASFVDCNGIITKEVPYSIPTGDISHTYGVHGAGQTNATVLFRTSLLREEELHAIAAQHFRVLDYPLYGLFAQRTQFAFIDTPTAAWREHNSVSNPQSLAAFAAYQYHYFRCWKCLEKQHHRTFGYNILYASGLYIYRVAYFLWRQLHNRFARRKHS